MLGGSDLRRRWRPSPSEILRLRLRMTLSRSDWKLRTENRQPRTENRELRTVSLHRYRYFFHDLAQDFFCLLRFLQGRGIAGVDYDAVGEAAHGQALEVFRGGEVAAFEKGHGLGGAVEHLRAAGRDAEGE